MKTLRTVYPYGLNERTRNMDPEAPVGTQLPPLERFHQRTVRIRSRRNKNIINNVQTFFNKINDLLNNDIKNAYYHIRVLLNNINKKLLRKIAAEIIHNGNQIQQNPKNFHQCSLYILDIIDSKLYKPNLQKKKKHHLNIFVQLNLIVK